jgi:hypothetical protein
MKLFPENLVGNYTTKLQNRIELEGEWEVGLAEIMYPVTWLNTKPMKIILTTREEKVEFTINLLPYETRSDIANKMNLLFRKNRLTIEAHNDIEKNSFMFTFRESNNVTSLELDLVLAKMLGFSTNLFLYLETSSGISSDSEQEDVSLDAILIYSNIISHQYIGDAYAKVLRTIAMDSEIGKKVFYVTKVFDIPHYVSLDTQDLDIININLRDLQGEQILFESGKVVIKLHFRKKYYNNGF